MHKWGNKWSDSKPELKRIYWNQFYFDTKVQWKLRQVRQEHDSLEKCSSSLFRAVEEGEGLNSVRWYLSIAIVWYYSISLPMSLLWRYLTPKFCLAPKKCGHASQWFLLGVNLLIYCIFILCLKCCQLPQNKINCERCEDDWVVIISKSTVFVCSVSWHLSRFYMSFRKRH